MESYVVFNWRVRRYRGRGDMFYTAHPHLAKRFESYAEAKDWCGRNERVERVLKGF